MSNELQGMVRAVVTTQAGGVGLTWTGNTLVVEDAHAFPRDGGQFKIEGYETAFSYVSVADGETVDDPDTITTVETAPGTFTGEFRLDLWPVAVSSVAEVAMPEALDDTVPAIIPHSLKPYLVDGVRDPEAQESVLIAQRDMAWYVVDILGQSEVRIPDVVAVVDDAKAEAMEAHTMATQATQDAQNAHNTAVEAQDAAADATAAAGTAQDAADAAAQAAADAAGTAEGKADVLIQPGAPATEMQKATTLWIDTTGGANKPKRWDGNEWVAVTDKEATDAAAAAAAAQTAATNAATAAQAAQDEAEDALAAAATAQSTADGKVTTFYGGTAPSATATGDLWVDTTANRLKRWNGSAWADVTDPVLEKALAAAGDAAATADGKVRTFAQDDPPTGMAEGDVGDLWVDTNDGNKLHRYSGSTWVAVQDASIATAKAAADAAAQDAATAAGIAGGKADVLIQPGAPAAAYQAATTLWIDTTSGANTPKRWNGSKWVAVTDKAATDAATAAANAQTTASNAATAAADAQTAADNAQAAAEAAQTAAGDAQTVATNALTSANGRNSRIVSTGDPGGTTNPRTGLAWVEGDTWWKWDSTTTKNVIGAWAYRNGDWEAEKIGDAVLAALDVNKLVVTGSANIDQAVIDKLVGNIALFDAFVGKTFTGGTFSGSDFYAPGIEAVPRIHVGETPDGKPIIELMRGDGAEEWRTVSIGGSDSDELMLYDDSGNPMSGFSGEGDGTVRRNLTVGGLAEVGGLTVDGDDIHAIIDRKPRGLIASAYGWLNIPAVGSAEAGLIRFPVIRFEPDRIYRIRFEVVATAATATDNLYLSIRNQNGGNATVASNLLYGQALPAGNRQAHTIEYIWNGTYGDVRNDSLLFTARNSTANRKIELEAGRKRTLATIEDLGTRAGNVGGVVTLAGGTAWTGYTPPPVVEPVQTYVKTYAAMETKVFYGAGTTSDGNLHHGIFNGITRYSWIRFNPQVKADTSGASVKKVEVRLRNTHTWNGSVGTFKIGTTTREATPTAVSHITPSTPVTVDWAHGATAWVNITGAGWHSTMIAVVLGEGASGNLQYGKFSANLADIQLRVTYEK